MQLLNGRICTLAELKRKWDTVCETHSLSQKEALEGMGEISRFANWMSIEQPIIVDINTPYTLVIGDVEVKGNLSPIFKKGEKHEFVITDFGKRIQDQTWLDFKLKYTIDAYIYRELFETDIAGIRVHNVKHNKDLKTMRMNVDYQRMETTIRSIGKAIQEGIYYTRESFTCPSCPAASYCKFWTREES